MPMHFDRLRLLNGGSRIRNESGKVLYLRALEDDQPIEVPPGGEQDLPYTLDGESIIDVEQPE